MIPTGDPSNDLFKMYGMYAEIFENLQVIIEIHLRKLDINYVYVKGYSK